MRRIYISLSKIFPQAYVEEMRQTLKYADINITAEVWLGESLALGTIIALTIFYLGNYGDQLLFTILAALAFFVYMIGAFNIPFFIAEKRAQAVEEDLPNALQLMSSNIKAGMTPFQAMKLAARDEFEVLKKALDKATTKALGTGSFSDALKDISKDIRLPALERAVKLFIRSIESGGHLATILEETARDINDNISLRKELQSSTKTYTVLILMVIMIGTPILMNVSIHFTERLNEMKSSFTGSAAEELGMGMMVSESFSVDYLINMSTITIAVTSTIASMLIGVINSGKEKYGIRYAFVIVPMSLTIFYIVRHAVKAYML